MEGSGRGEEWKRGEEKLTPKMYGGLIEANEKRGFSLAMNSCAALSARILDAVQIVQSVARGIKKSDAVQGRR